MCVEARYNMPSHGGDEGTKADEDGECITWPTGGLLKKSQCQNVYGNLDLMVSEYAQNILYYKILNIGVCDFGYRHRAFINIC